MRKLLENYLIVVLGVPISLLIFIFSLITILSFINTNREMSIYDMDWSRVHPFPEEIIIFNSDEEKVLYNWTWQVASKMWEIFENHQETTKDSFVTGYYKIRLILSYRSELQRFSFFPNRRNYITINFYVDNILKGKIVEIISESDLHYNLQNLYRRDLSRDFTYSDRRDINVNQQFLLRMQEIKWRSETLAVYIATYNRNDRTVYVFQDFMFELSNDTRISNFKYINEFLSENQHLLHETGEPGMYEIVVFFEPENWNDPNIAIFYLDSQTTNRLKTILSESAVDNY